jgi:hypothetical protein
MTHSRKRYMLITQNKYQQYIVFYQYCVVQYQTTDTHSTSSPLSSRLIPFLSGLLIVVITLLRRLLYCRVFKHNVESTAYFYAAFSALLHMYMQHEGQMPDTDCTDLYIFSIPNTRRLKCDKGDVYKYSRGF